MNEKWLVEYSNGSAELVDFPVGADKAILIQVGATDGKVDVALSHDSGQLPPWGA